MKSSLIALALVSPLLATGTALSFPTGRDFSVNVEGNVVGRVNARNRVVDTGEACTYTLQWTLGTSPLSRTVRCDISERKASNAFDCESNRTRWITSLVEKTGSCTGFDEFGQQTRISTLIGGESSAGVSGVFFAASVGDLQSLQIR